MRKIILSLLTAFALASLPDETLAGWGKGCGPVGPSNAEAGRFFRRRSAPVYQPVYERSVQPAQVIEVKEQPKEQAAAPKGCECSKTCDCGLECVCAEQGPCSEGCNCHKEICKCPGKCGCKDHCQCAAKKKACSDNCWCAGDGLKMDQLPGDKKANFGLQLEKLKSPDTAEEIRLNGQPVTKARAIEAIEGRRRPGPDPQPEPGPDPGPKPNGIPDDANKTRLTIIGPDADRQRALADLAKLPDPGWVVRDYPPDHWHVAQAGFKTDGHPTIYLQAPDGKVLYRQDDYAGPEDWGAIRKADPNYKPEADPGRDNGSEIPPSVLVMGGLAALVILPHLFRKASP